MWATLVTMYKTEGGVLALYRGIIPTVAGVAPYVRYGHFDDDSDNTNPGTGRVKLYGL